MAKNKDNKGKEETKMAEPILIATAKKQPVPVMNLDTGNAEDKVTIVYSNYGFKEPAKDSDPEEYSAQALTEAFQLFGNDKLRIANALVDAAGRLSYAEGKTAAMNGGNYLTQELKTRIVGFMRASISKFAEMKASDTFNAWLEGYKAKKPGAVKILQTVSASDEFGDL